MTDTAPTTPTTPRVVTHDQECNPCTCDLATVRDAADWLGVDAGRIRSLLRNGTLTRVDVAGRVMVRMSEVSDL